MVPPDDKKLEEEYAAAAALPEDGDSFYGLSDEDIDNILEALDREDSAAVESAISDLGPADTAELLSKVSEEDREQILSEHAAAIDPRAYAELPPEMRQHALEMMAPQQVAAIIAELESDDALYLIENLEPSFRQDVIRKLSAKMRLTLEEGLNYPEESAGRLMQREFVAIPQFWTVGKAIDYMRAAADELPDEFFDLFVISPTYRVVGEVPLNRLVRARRAVKMEDLALEEIHTVPADMDQEEVAQIFRRENLMSAPVIDSEDRLIGVITIDDIIDVIDEEAQEDILLLGRISETDLYAPPLQTSWRRVRWLLITLVNTLIASFVISRFEATIEEIVALAVLMPIVAAMGGNAGMQVVTVTVRALATRELSPRNFPRLVGKEIIVGMINGLTFGIILGVLATLWFGSPMLGAILMAAMMFNMIWAGIAGAAIPITLDRFGADPALAAGPLLTTTTDVLGFFAFLGLATLFLIH